MRVPWEGPVGWGRGGSCQDGLLVGVTLTSLTWKNYDGSKCFLVKSVGLS